MSQAPAYVPSESFSDAELNNAGGRSSVRTALLDAEFSAISVTTTALRVNLALIQRDDGKLTDSLVEPYNLSAITKAYLLATKWNARGLWATLNVYALNDLVDVGGVGYVCAIPHAAGVFATDYAAGYWQIFSAPTTAAAVSFAPTANLLSTNAQAAIVEADANARAGINPVLSTFYGAM